MRAAVPDDARAVAEVHLRSRAEAMPWLPEVHSPDEVRLWVRDLLLPTGRVQVVDAGAEVVAYSATSDGWLDHLYVLPEAQRHGHGRALLQRAQERSGGALRLHVFARNTRARAFYAAAGFAEVGPGTGGEERLPDLVLEWRARAG